MHVGGWWAQIALCFSTFPSRNFVHSDIDLIAVGHRSCEIQGNFNVNSTDSVCDDYHFAEQSEHAAFCDSY